MTAIIFLLTTCMPHPNSLDSLGFFSGLWRNSVNGVISEEIWTSSEGGVMLGVNRTINNGKVVFFEYLRIEATEEGIFYVAMPMGHSPTRFRLVSEESDRVVFENKKHDFPQRIIYIRESDNELRGRIEGTEGGEEKSSEWGWSKAEF
ncbi:MAG: hypothetical protein KDC35_17970 [Acidobacteria bacterium]|nr:hypothetical protein [Acidobacteriota bacterium]